jgi:NAD(P) transhydrogenase subunit alpha
MRPGSIIVDLAVEQGGNVEGAEFGRNVLTGNGVTIIGPANLPSEIAVDASQLYARNLLAFLGLIIDKDANLKIDRDDEIVKATLLTLDGVVVHPQLAAA